jgi:hypothetical protein
VEELSCGVVIPPGRVDLVAHAIRDANAGKYDLEAMGSRGREYVTREVDKTVAVQKYRELLLDVAGR